MDVVVVSKLLVAVRADLPVGLQLAQAIHAALLLVRVPLAAPLADRTITVFHVAGEAALRELFSRAGDRGVASALWCEPDLDGQATAVAMCGDGAAGVCRGLVRAFESTPL